ncbi:MAG: AAA family ATPase [Deltaproteobacteria bacterium]|nr:AAA family ATPase [Deltaproteobacteria bacterium]
MTAWRVTATGGSAWIAIEGASGLGKTTLMAAFEQSIEAEVLRGRCYERESVAYKGIDEVVEALVARLVAHDVFAAEAADLVHAFPSAHELVPHGTEIAPASRVGHDRRGAALRVLLAQLAAITPVVIALDDIQWADRDCLALLAQALAAPGIPRVTLVVTARPGATARWRELPMPFVHVTLGPLAPADSIELARQLSGDTLAADDLRVIAAQASGLPMEIVERVRTLLASTEPSEPTLASADDLLSQRVADATLEVRLLVELVVTAGAGSWARADVVAVEAAELFDRMPELGWERNTASVVATAARAHRGDLVALTREVRRERERTAASGDLYAHEIAHSGFAVLVDLMLDQPAQATARLETLTARPTGLYTAWLRLIAHGLVGAYGDRPASHSERVEALVSGPLSFPILRGSFLVGTMLWTRIILELSASGVTDRALMWIDRLRGNTVRGMNALAELLAAHAAALTGDRSQARDRAAAAELSLATDDMPMFAASARWLIDPSTWPAWRDQLAKAGAVRPAALARVFAPSFR